MKQLFNYFCTVIFFYGLLIKTHAQTQTFDNLNANDGIDKFLTWNTVINGSNYGFRWGNRSGTIGGDRSLLDIAVRHNNSGHTSLMTFATNGSIGIKNTSPNPGYALDINGRTFISDQLGIGAMPGSTSGYKLRVQGGQSLFEDMILARSLMVEGPNLGSESAEGSIYFHHWGVNTHRLRFSTHTLYLENCANLGFGSSGIPNFSVQGRILLPTSSTSTGHQTGIGLLGNYDGFEYDGQYINHYGFGFHNYDEGVSVDGINAYISSFFGIDFFTQGKSRMRINNNGNVGIKTNDPKHSLQIGNGTTNESLVLAGSETSSNLYIGFQEGLTHKYVRMHYNTANNLLKITSDMGDIIFFNRVTQNIGIGTNTLNNPNGYKLAVNGKIGAKEIIVENTSSTWPDYVFEKNYPLSSLEEVEHFIEANKHLPEIPAAREIEEKGINLGDIITAQQKKIEELTLYLIEINKQLKNQEAQLQKLLNVSE